MEFGTKWLWWYVCSIETCCAMENTADLRLGKGQIAVWYKALTLSHKPSWKAASVRFNVLLVEISTLICCWTNRKRDTLMHFQKHFYARLAFIIQMSWRCAKDETVKLGHGQICCIFTFTLCQNWVSIFIPSHKSTKTDLNLCRACG